MKIYNPLHINHPFFKILIRQSCLTFLLILSSCGGSSSDGDSNADITAPVITISGDSTTSIFQGSDYTDAGASATDNIDGTITVTTTDEVDTTTIGTYSVIYNATDSAGNNTSISRTVNVIEKTLTGTAAAGAAIIGTVTVKGSLGMTTSALIEADGNYNVSVAGLTPPYRIRAQGTVGGKTYKLHSYAQEAIMGETVNITPFTDLIIANTAQQLAENFFDSDTTIELNETELANQEDVLQAKLQDVFDALGLDTAINLLNTAFSADHSGLDAALDIIQIENTAENIVTITNLLDGASIEDDISNTDDNDTNLPIDPDEVITAVSDIEAISNLFDNFSAQFTGGLPTQAAISDFFSTDFLEEDAGKGEFLTDITSDPTLIGLTFISTNISDLDSDAGTATVSFNVSFGDEIDNETIYWLAGRDETLGWQLRGDQRIVDLETLNFHCNDYDGTDELPGACGINVAFWDEDFSNNGTGGDPIASGTAMLIDGDTGEIKATVYLGNPEWAGAGENQVYNEATGGFQGDWRAFGLEIGEINPALFAVGDIIEYNLYTQALDTSTPSAPAVNVGFEVATYTNTLAFTPSTTGLYPSASTTTLSAIENYTLGDDLTVSWQLATGTVSDEVLVEISDAMGNRIEIWDESFSASATSTSFSGEAFAAAILDNENFDSNSSELTLLVRFYAADATTGQAHSTDYRASISNPPIIEEPPNENLACGYESGWNDEADDGFGAPITPNSFADFTGVIASCGGTMQMTAADIAGKTFIDFDEVSTFDETGSATEANPGRGTIIVDDEDTFVFEWYIETIGNNTYLVQYFDSNLNPTLPQGFSGRETIALISLTGEIGVSGTQYELLHYYEQSNYSDMVRNTGSDGEIWKGLSTLQP